MSLNDLLGGDALHTHVPAATGVPARKHWPVTGKAYGRRTRPVQTETTRCPHAERTRPSAQEPASEAMKGGVR